MSRLVKWTSFALYNSHPQWNHRDSAFHNLCTWKNDNDFYHTQYCIFFKWNAHKLKIIVPLQKEEETPTRCLFNGNPLILRYIRFSHCPNIESIIHNKEHQKINVYWRYCLQKSDLAFCSLYIFSHSISIISYHIILEYISVKPVFFARSERRCTAKASSLGLESVKIVVTSISNIPVCKLNANSSFLTYFVHFINSISSLSSFLLVPNRLTGLKQSNPRKY